jgi:ribonucleoside-diphosphate reductase alpha chain
MAVLCELACTSKIDTGYKDEFAVSDSAEKHFLADTMTKTMTAPDPAILARFTNIGEQWEDIVERVASVGTAADRPLYRDLIAQARLVPGGQILRGAGRADTILYNCFVTGVGDEEAAEDLAARITAWTERGAGVGVNLDNIAARVRRHGGSLCTVIETIARSQHRLWLAGVRRTATMVTLALADPEAEAAAYLLTSEDHYRHLNLGILVTDADLVRGASTLDKLAATAWATGNPGFLFVDRIQRDHIFSEKVRACNPCGEQFLAEEEGCNLASLNLAAFVGASGFDWTAFAQAAETAVRFLDDVIDASAFPSSATELMARRRRRIGLGVLGFASALHMLGIVYGTDESVQFASRLARTLRDHAESASQQLARLRGAFPDDATRHRRNSHLLSIAPTGAISLLWNVSSGIEPMFGDRINKGGLRADFGTGGTSRPLRGHEVPGIDHIAVLAAWQTAVDGGISKTVNLAQSACVAEIRKLLIAARDQGCKGISFFRQNSRQAAVLVEDALP